MKQACRRENIGRMMWSLNAQIAIVRTSISWVEDDRRLGEAGFFPLKSEGLRVLGVRYKEESTGSVCNGSRTYAFFLLR